nr:TlpA disulfide reductase family protein [Nocardioides marmorisolisilvae]
MPVLLIALGSGCSLGGVSQASDDHVLRTGWSATDVAVPKAAARMKRIGSAGPLQIRTDRPIVINFWSSTCGPCRKEMPMLERLSHDGVQVVGVSRDNLLKYARKEIRDRKVTFPNYSDASGDVMFGLSKVLYPNGIPTTIVVSGGRVRWVHIGAFASYSELHRSVLNRLTP